MGKITIDIMDRHLGHSTQVCQTAQEAIGVIRQKEMEGFDVFVDNTFTRGNELTAEAVERASYITIAFPLRPGNRSQ